MRRIRAAAFFLATLACPVARACPTLPGDVAPGTIDSSTNPPTYRITGNGIVDVGDVVAGLRASVGLQALAYTSGGSATCLAVPGDIVPARTYSGTVPVLSPLGDATLNIADVVALLRTSVGLQAVEYRDGDGDGTFDFDDGCPFAPDPGQLDTDGDGIGDECDVAVLGFRLSDQAPGVSDGDGVPEVGERLFLDTWMDRPSGSQDLQVHAVVTSAGATLHEDDSAVLRGSDSMRTATPFELSLAPSFRCDQPLQVQLTFTQDDGQAAGTSTISISVPSATLFQAWDFSAGAGGWTGTFPWHVATMAGVTRWWDGDSSNCDGGSTESTLTSPSLVGVPAGSVLAATYRQADDSATAELQVSVNGGSSWDPLIVLPANDGVLSVVGPVQLPASSPMLVRFHRASGFTSDHGLEVMRVTIHSPGATCGTAAIAPLPQPLLPTDTGNADALALAGQDRFEDHRIAAAHDEFTRALNSDSANGRAAFLRAWSEVVGPIAEGWSSPSAGPVHSWWELLDSVGVARSQRDAFALPAPDDNLGNIPDVLPATTPDGDELQLFIADVFRSRVRAALADLDRMPNGTFQLLIDSAAANDAQACAPRREADEADVHGSRAVLSFLDGVLSVVVALDLDAVDIDELANDGTLQLQRDILDTHADLLKLRPSGATDLAAARSAFIESHAETVLALDEAHGEGDVQDDDLFRISSLFPTAADETEFRDTLSRWRAALDGPSQVEPNDPQLVSLLPFFQGSVSPRAQLPRFISAARGSGTVEVADAATLAPDPTIAGTFPGRTREDWLDHEGKYGSAFERSPGIRADGVAETITTATTRYLDGYAVNGSGPDLRIDVLAGSGTYDIDLQGRDLAGISTSWSVGGQSGSSTLDLTGTGLNLVERVTVTPVDVTVLLDAIQALH